jgi:hypothetical protein
MNTYRVGATKDDATCDILSVEVIASSPVAAAQKYEAMDYDVWEEANGRRVVWVDDDSIEGPVCVDLDEGEVVGDGEEDA